MPSQPMPMLATPSTNTTAEFERLVNTGDWQADVKLDGVRCWIHWSNGVASLLNRNGVKITARYPEVVAWAQEELAGQANMLIDGEIIANDGSFETVLTRDKQTNTQVIERQMVTKPVTFYAFDLPTHPGVWHERRAALSEVIDTRLTVLSDSPDFFAKTRELGLEGVIAKRVNGRYEFGARSASWLKFKNVVRVTCIAYAYTPGTGRRAHFGAMQLALLDDAGTPISVGRVGTGFTDKIIAELKGHLDNHEMLAVEIECLNKTSGNQLRFPSYKGIRTDVPVKDCSIHQLDTIATC